MDQSTYIADEAAAGERIDVWLARASGLSRSFIRTLLDSGNVTLAGGSVPKPSRPIAPGDCVTVSIPVPEEPSFVPEDFPLDIVYEDDRLAVVNKPPGMVVHPGRGNRRGTLAGALLYRYGELSSVGGPFRPGIVHRLDKNTSGLLVVALDDAMHRRLSAMLQAREISRRYTAFVWGTPREETGVIDAPIGRNPKYPTRKAVVDGGRPARTRYKIVRRYVFLSRLDAALETGRTHQIRVHFAHIGHHVFGDPEYGGREERLGGFSPDIRLEARRLLRDLPRQALHASELAFRHPVTGRDLVFTSPLPPDLAALERHLESE